MKRFTALFLVVIFVLSMGNTVYAEETEANIPTPSEAVVDNLQSPSNSPNQTPIPVETGGDSIGTPIPSETPQASNETSEMPSPSESINEDLNQLLLISKALSSFLNTEIILENQNDLENVLLTYKLIPIEIQAEQTASFFDNDLISPIIVEVSGNNYGLLIDYLTDEQNAITSLTMLQADATETIIGIDDVASLWAYTIKESEDLGESSPTPSATGAPSASPSALSTLATPAPSVSAEPIDEALAEEVESKAIGSVSLDTVEILENSGEIAIAKGETITLSASAVTNTTEALEYKFYYQKQGADSWSVVHSGYIAGTPELGQAEFKPGAEATYNFKVQVRTVGTASIEAEDVFDGDISVYFGDYPARGITILPLKKTHYEYSETIPLEVTVEQNSKGSPVEYRLRYSTNGSKWSVLASTKYWPDLDLDEGGNGVIPVQLPTAGDRHYFIKVEIRTQFRTTVDVSDICEVDMYKYMPLESVTLDSVAGFTSEDEMVLVKGETIEIRTSAAAKDGYAPELVDYRVLYQRPGTTKWYYVSSKYTTGTLDEGLIIFKPKYEGVYHFKVEARTKGRRGTDVNADFEAPIGIYFGELPANGVSIAEITKTNYEYTENIPVEISVLRSHNNAEVEYQVMYSTNNRSWRVPPEYKLWQALTLSDENTADLQISIPSGADRHLYIKVNIRSESRQGVDVSDVFEVDMYKVMPLEQVTLARVNGETNGGEVVLEKGQAITLSAASEAKSGYLPEQVDYRFLYQRPGSSKWFYVSKRFVSGTLANGEIQFIPKYEGSYAFKVQARTKGRSAFDAEDIFDEQADLYFGDVPLTSLSFSTDLMTQEAYQPIIIYPVIEDLDEGDQAEIRITAKRGTSTYLVRDWIDYEANMEVVWKPTRVGTYTLIVEGRKKARTGTDVTESKDGYGITPVIPVEGVAFNPTPEDSFVDHETELNGVIVGDAHSDDAEYRFSYRINSSKWKVIQDWTSDDGCLFTPLVSGTYTYRVEARSPGQASGYAYCTVACSVVREKPPAPTISTDKTEYAYMEDIVVAWSDTARATHHDLYIYKDGIWIDRTKNLTGTSTTINLPEGSYEVSVAAVNETGFTFAEQRAAFIVNRDKPTAITDFRTSQSVYTNPCDVVFNWTHAERITHYDLYIYDSETGDFVTGIAPITDNTAMATLEYGKYKANILAINEEGYTVSNWTEFEVKIQKPGAPTYTTSQRVFDIDGDIELAWTAADRAFSYTLHIYSVQKDNEVQEELVWHKAIAGIVTTHTTIELDEGTYVVFPGATNTTGTTFGSAIRIKVEDVQPLEGVSLSVTVNGQSVSTAYTGTAVTMTASILGSVHTNDAEYAFYYQNEYDGWNPWDLIQDWSTSNTVTFTPPVASDYILIVLARSPGETTHSAWANKAFSVLELTQPDAPTFIQGQRLFDVNEDIHLEWTSSERAYSYTLHVYEKTGPDSLVWYGDFPGIVTTSAIIKLPLGTYYVFPGATNPTGTTFGPSTEIKVENFVPIQGLIFDPIPIDSAIGNPILLQGRVTGDIHVNDAEYCFAYQFNNLPEWHIIQDWSSDNNVSFTPSTAGTYRYILMARSPGKTDYEQLIYVDRSVTQSFTGSDAFWFGNSPNSRAETWGHPIKAGYSYNFVSYGDFGEGRDNDTRAHAGLDFRVATGSNTLIVAMTGGVVKDNRPFFSGTDQLVVKNDDGSIIRYCEIRSSLSIGTPVNQGDIIGYTVPNDLYNTEMLHLEIYANDLSIYGDLTWPLSSPGNDFDYRFVPIRNYERRNDLIDPTYSQYLPRQ